MQLPTGLHRAGRGQKQSGSTRDRSLRWRRGSELQSL